MELTKECDNVSCSRRVEPNVMYCCSFCGSSSSYFEHSIECDLREGVGRFTKVKMTDEQYARMREAQFEEHRKLVAIASRLLFLTDLAKKEYEER